jgi:hypothetical protein
VPSHRQRQQTAPTLQHDIRLRPMTPVHRRPRHLQGLPRSTHRHRGLRPSIPGRPPLRRLLTQACHGRHLM